VLPYVSFRVPCLAPPPLVDEAQMDEIAAAKQTQRTAAASQPRFLPLPLLLLLTLFFAGLTAMALGSTGVSALATRFTGLSFDTSSIASIHIAAPLTPEQRTSAEHEAVRQAHQAESMRARAAATNAPHRASSSASSSSSWLPLLDLPPVPAVAFEWLLEHEYLSLFVWLVRSYPCRFLWHALLWWHVLCAAATVFELLRWRVRMARFQRPSQLEHANEAAPVGFASRSLPLFVAHVIFWAAQSALFGWPSVYLLRQQLHAKTKRT
jgi:hypothetical protein